MLEKNSFSVLNEEEAIINISDGWDRNKWWGWSSSSVSYAGKILDFFEKNANILLKCKTVMFYNYNWDRFLNDLENLCNHYNKWLKRLNRIIHLFLNNIPLHGSLDPWPLLWKQIICYKHCQGTWLGARSVSHASQACPAPAMATPLVNRKTCQRFVHIILPTLSYYLHQKYCQIL